MTFSCGPSDRIMSSRERKAFRLSFGIRRNLLHVNLDGKHEKGTRGQCPVLEQCRRVDIDVQVLIPPGRTFFTLNAIQRCVEFSHSVPNN